MPKEKSIFAADKFTDEAVRLYTKYGGGYFLAMTLFNIWIKANVKQLFYWMNMMRKEGMKRAA
jgi:hypothetical protein